MDSNDNVERYLEYVPFEYGEIASIANIYQPSTQKNYNNHAFMFWQRTLFQRASSSMIFKLPKEWNGNKKDFFLYVMFKVGYCVVFKLEKYGLVFQPCTLSGQNLYYQPTEVLVSNPAISECPKLVIGKNCELLKLTPDYRGIWDIIRYYAEKLALIDSALNMSISNAKVAYILGAKNKNAATALKVIMDKVNAGQTAVFYDKAIENDINGGDPWIAFDRRNVKDAYMGSELLDNVRTLINNFDSEIGIPTMPSEKKERMVTDEVNSRLIDGMSRAIVWEECFNESAVKVNKMFTTNIGVEFRYKGILKVRKGGGDVSEDNTSGIV